MMQTPVEIYGVQTADDYRVKQRRTLKRTRSGEPHAATVTPEMVILTDDSLRVKCGCGDFAVVHPDWRLGLCMFCGAVYEDVPVPELD